jgi:hypothetical protein
METRNWEREKRRKRMREGIHLMKSEQKENREGNPIDSKINMYKR